MNIEMKQTYDNHKQVSSSINQKSKIINAWREKKKKSSNVFEWKESDEEKKPSLNWRKQLNGREKISQMEIALHAATGAIDEDLAIILYAQCSMAAGLDSMINSKTQVTAPNIILSSLTALRPQDELEGMLITRMISLHFQSMKYLIMAGKEGQPAQGIDININRSTKLMRMFNESVEALNRYRRKGEQRVVVQHMQVNDGGKAIVSGTIETTGGGK
jgi:hypothetical protein